MRILRIIILLFLSVVPSYASITFPWTTTFNCPEWTTFSDPLVCDGLSKGLAGSSANGNYTSITAAANYSGGAGGKGLRHYICSKAEKDTFERHSIGDSGGAITYFVQKPEEFWVRWYVRFQAGYSIYGQKLLYHHLTSGSGYLNFPYGTNGIRFYEQSQGGLPPAQHLYCGDCGWQDLFGGASDGRWICVEQHIKSQNPVSASNGIYQLWIDGVLKIDKTDAKYSTSSTQWSDIYWGSNGDGHDGAPGDIYIDYDDIEISLTGYIGPLGGGGGDTSSPVTNSHSPSGTQACVESDSTQDMTVSFVGIDASQPLSCELGTSSTFIYGTGLAMTPASGGSGATYSYTFTDQACGQSYLYYRKCRDSASTPNTTGNTDAAANPLSYDIGTYPGSADPPVIESITPELNADLVCVYNPRDVTVQAVNVTGAYPPFALKISSVNDFDYDTQGTPMIPQATGASGETHSYIFNGGNSLACGSDNTFYIKIKDATGTVYTQTVVHFTIAVDGSAQPILYEGFDDSSLAGRNWFDGPMPGAAYIVPGGISGNCLKIDYTTGSSVPDNWARMRKKFSPTEEFTAIVWSKLDNSFVGSGHLIYLYSTSDSDYTNLANNYLQVYIEEVGLSPAIEIQDNRNVNTSQPLEFDFANAGQYQTENRSVNRCNGYLTTQSTGSVPICFFSDIYQQWYSATYFYGNSPLTHGSWILSEVYVRLNSVIDGKGVPNGVIEYRINNQVVLYDDKVMFRTGQNPGIMIDKIAIAPYIGAGSSVNQTMYLDELSIFNGRRLEGPAPTNTGRFSLSNINSGSIGWSSPGTIPVTIYP